MNNRKGPDLVWVVRKESQRKYHLCQDQNRKNQVREGEGAESISGQQNRLKQGTELGMGSELYKTLKKKNQLGWIVMNEEGRWECRDLGNHQGEGPWKRNQSQVQQ